VAILLATSVILTTTWWDKLVLLSTDTLPEDFESRVRTGHAPSDPVAKKA